MTVACRKCEWCNGTGLVRPLRGVCSPCPTCGGTGEGSVAKHSDYQAFQGIGQCDGCEHPATSAGKLPPTTPDILGPFYKPGAPDRPDGKLTDLPTIHLEGRVLDTDGSPVSGAVLDFWQADPDGNYDNGGFVLRGKVKAQSGPYPWAIYHLHTVRPGHYKISDPGQPDEFRCSHLHVIVTAPGFKSLTTQLYFPDDPLDASDHWYSPTRLLTPVPDCSDARRYTFDFVLEKE